MDKHLMRPAPRRRQQLLKQHSPHPMLIIQRNRRIPDLLDRQLDTHTLISASNPLHHDRRHKPPRIVCSHDFIRTLTHHLPHMSRNISDCFLKPHRPAPPRDPSQPGPSLELRHTPQQLTRRTRPPLRRRCPDQPAPAFRRQAILHRHHSSRVSDAIHAYGRGVPI